MNAGVDLASRPDADVNRSRRGGAHRAPPQPCKRLPPAHRREESGTLQTAVGSRFGGLPRTFWIVFVGMIANRIGTMVIPFMVFYLGSRGISTTDTGAIIVALGIGGMVGPPLGGLLADRFGPRLAVIVGLVVTPFSFGALLAAPTPFMLGVAATLLGVTGSVYKPAASAMVGEVVGPQSRLKAFSLLHWGFNIGTAVAAGAAGFLAERGYWLLFLIDGITCLVYALIVLCRHTERPAAAGGRRQDREWRRLRRRVPGPADGRVPGLERVGHHRLHPDRIHRAAVDPAGRAAPERVRAARGAERGIGGGTAAPAVRLAVPTRSRPGAGGLVAADQRRGRLDRTRRSGMAVRGDRHDLVSRGGGERSRSRLVRS